MRVQVNQEGLKIISTHQHQHLVYADDVNIMAGRVHTIKGGNNFGSRY